MQALLVALVLAGIAVTAVTIWLVDPALYGFVAGAALIRAAQLLRARADQTPAR